MRATFFVQGRWAEAQPETGTLDRGRRPPDRPSQLLPRTHAAAARRGDRHRRAGRPPRGPRSDRASTPGLGSGVRSAPGHDDPRVLGVLEGLGFRNVYWNVVLEDWEATRTGEAITRDAIDGVRAHGDGAVVLLHTWPGRHGRGGRPHDRRTPGARRLLRHRRRPGDAPVSRLPAILAVDGGGSKIDAVLLRQGRSGARRRPRCHDRLRPRTAATSTWARSRRRGGRQRRRRAERRSVARRRARRLLPRRRRLPGRRPPDRPMARGRGGHG